EFALELPDLGLFFRERRVGQRRSRSSHTRDGSSSAWRYSHEAMSAPHSGAKKASRITHGLILAGSVISRTAAQTAAATSAHPRNAFAEYQIAALPVPATRNPYTPFGGTMRRISGRPTIA